MLSLHKNKKLFLSTIAIAAIVIPAAAFSINKFMAINDTSAITYAIPEGYTTFTDPNFYNCVAKEYKDDHPNEDISNGLADEQLAGMTSLECSGWGKPDNEKISDTAGLEKMIGLTDLDLSRNNLTSLDVSNNTVLTSLDVGSNQLTSLDVSNNTMLTSLDVSSNQLTSLDISNNTALTMLYVGSNQLTSLDLSNNTALTNLFIGMNQLTSLDLSNNTALTKLNVGDNQLTSLDVSNNTALTELRILDSRLTSLDVSNNTALTELRANNNQLTSLDVSHNTKLTILSITQTQLTSLDVSNNTALTELHVYNNQLTSLDVSNNTALTYLIANDNQLISLNVSGAIALTDLRVANNQFTSLDASGATALTKLYIYNNQLASLDISNNTALAELYIDDNQLASLDVSNNTALTSLNAHRNQLTSLDVSNNTALTKLSVSNNQLTSLDVTNNKALTWLTADNIPIQTNLELNSLEPNLKLDLSGLGFLRSPQSATYAQSIIDTDNYIYDSDDKIATINNPGGTGGYIQVSSESDGLTYKLQIPNFLTFDANGGNGDFETLYCYPESGTTECPVTTPETRPTRDGYYFIGWAEDPNATSASYWINETITLDRSKTLYAVWVNITNNTNYATINTTAKNSFNITSDKACIVLWTNNYGTTWNRINSNTVAGNNNMRRFDIGQLGNVEIVVNYMGDTNSDKDINVRDARKITNTIMNKDTLTNLGEILADVNNDNNINVRDARVINNSIMGKTEIAW